MKIKHLFILISAAYCMLSISSAQTVKKSVSTKYDIAAIVWPAYQPEERFKEIGVFPDGKGEWETIYKAKPKFKGHHQPNVPLWGYENEADPKVMEKKIKTATSYGVNVFIYDWYWYDGKPYLENALNNGFLKAANNNKMKFYLMWANHDHTSYLDPSTSDKSKVYWKGAVDRNIFDNMISHIITDYFKRPNYYKINGEPVFAIYEVGTFIKGLGGIKNAEIALEYFRNKTKEAGFPGLHIQGFMWSAFPESISDVPGDNSVTQENTIKQLGINSITNYQWVHVAYPDCDYKKWGEKAISEWDKYNKNFSVPYFPHVSIGWDPNPRYPDKEIQKFVKNTNPKQFKVFLERAKGYVDAHPNQPKLITINAWNEWAEGSYLEPDDRNGYAYLNAIKKIFKNK